MLVDKHSPGIHCTLCLGMMNGFSVSNEPVFANDRKSKPEQKARDQIDAQLRAAGKDAVLDYAALGVIEAVRVRSYLSANQSPPSSSK